ncbi:hypothetical protein [Mycobacterium sp. 852013-50091_SCH5140682]|uniref:hypothetical protein n=1 Tax=Mycobacterium sp. 852013-50091_SCH5140682 TaxID=1834109 RepID=UPI000A51DC58|nr:hypothetical protein [Mycobacterium sp. 852013-50091_SCH5140682]
MSDALNVDTVRLQAESDRTFAHMTESRIEHSAHDDALLEAAGQWPGDIGAAIAFIADKWSEQREDLHRHIGRIGIGMQDSAVAYAATDGSAAEAIDSVSGGLTPTTPAIGPRDM